MILVNTTPETTLVVDPAIGQVIIPPYSQVIGLKYSSRLLYTQGLFLLLDKDELQLAKNEVHEDEVSADITTFYGSESDNSARWYTEEYLVKTKAGEEPQNPLTTMFAVHSLYNS